MSLEGTLLNKEELGPIVEEGGLHSTESGVSEKKQNPVRVPLCLWMVREQVGPAGAKP